ALLWNERPRPREIVGATLGLVGMGSIGREVARLAVALGMKVIAVRRNFTTEGTNTAGKQEVPRLGLTPSLGMTNIEQVYSPVDIDSLLAQSDFVVLAAPVTPETRGMINASRLAAMKP